MKETPGIKHALLVRQAIAENNYHKFFRLYKDAPNMGSYLMKFIFSKIRFQALLRITKVCRPSVPISHVKKELAFKKDIQCIKFLSEHYCVFSPDNKEVSCKESYMGLKRWEKEEEEKHKMESQPKQNSDSILMS